MDFLQEGACTHHDLLAMLLANLTAPQAGTDALLQVKEGATAGLYLCAPDPVELSGSCSTGVEQAAASYACTWGFPHPVCSGANLLCSQVQGFGGRCCSSLGFAMPLLTSSLAPHGVHAPMSCPSHSMQSRPCCCGLATPHVRCFGTYTCKRPCSQGPAAAALPGQRRAAARCLGAHRAGPHQCDAQVQASSAHAHVEIYPGPFLRVSWAQQPRRASAAAGAGPRRRGRAGRAAGPQAQEPGQAPRLRRRAAQPLLLSRGAIQAC